MIATSSSYRWIAVESLFAAMVAADADDVRRYRQLDSYVIYDCGRHLLQLLKGSVGVDIPPWSPSQCEVYFWSTSQ